MAKKVKESIASQIMSIKNRLSAMDEDVEKFEVEGKKTYSTKLRNSLADVGKAIKGLRVEILETRKRM
jgi:hypothetical protein